MVFICGDLVIAVLAVSSLYLWLRSFYSVDILNSEDKIFVIFSVAIVDSQ